MPEGVDVSIALLRYMGYQTERTEWDFSDLAPKAQQRIRSMYLVSSYRDGFDNFQIFHIELYQDNGEQILKTGRLLPILDTFLRRYSQGRYLFIFSTGNSHIVLFHLRKTEWRENLLLMRYVSRYVDLSHLHNLDRWLFESLRLTAKEQSPVQVWAKHRAVFDELRQQRKRMLRKRRQRPLLLERYYEDIYRFRSPSQEHKDGLVERLRQGDETAKEEIIHAHLWLVVHEAKKYQNLGLKLIDLIQEGNVGLLTALEKFDSTRGLQFSTYATWWVKQKILRALADSGSMIRIPVHVRDNKISRITAIEKNFIRELGFIPGTKAVVLEYEDFSLEECCEAWCCWVNQIPLSYEFEKRFQQAYYKMKKLLDVAQGVLSLDTALQDAIVDGQDADILHQETNLSLAEIIVGTDNGSEATVNQRLFRDEIQDLLSQIPFREKEIINARYGLLEHDASTLQEVADRMGVTRERIRQIESTALKRLCTHKSKLKLNTYFHDSPVHEKQEFQINGCDIGDFSTELPKIGEHCAERKLVRTLARRRFQEEIERWKKFSYPELLAEIRRNAHRLQYDDSDISLTAFVENYKSPEAVYRANVANSFDFFERVEDTELEQEYLEEMDEQE
jgi:RNA polymerase primary sigma factor